MFASASTVLELSIKGAATDLFWSECGKHLSVSAILGHTIWADLLPKTQRSPKIVQQPTPCALRPSGFQTREPRP